MTLKFYKIIDTDHLSDIQDWVLNYKSNRGIIIEAQGNYTVVVNDALGLVPTSPQFETEFGEWIESYIPE